MDVIYESSCGYELNAQSGTHEGSTMYQSLKYSATYVGFLAVPFIHKTSIYHSLIRHRNIIFRQLRDVISQDSKKVCLLLRIVVLLLSLSEHLLGFSYFGPPDQQRVPA